MLAGLALALELALELALGLLTTKASSVAETAAEAGDDDGEAEPGRDGEPVPEAEAEGDVVPEGDDVPADDPVAGDEFGAVGAAVEPDGDGAAGGLLGELPELLLDGVAVGEDEDGVGVGGVVEWVGVGVGEGVPDAGSAWHLVSVFALAPAEAPELGEAADASRAVRLGRARPARVHAEGQETYGQHAEYHWSHVRLTHEARPVYAAHWTLLCAFRGIWKRLGDGWVWYSYPVPGQLCMPRTSDHG